MSSTTRLSKNADSLFEHDALIALMEIEVREFVSSWCDADIDNYRVEGNRERVTNAATRLVRRLELINEKLGDVS